MNKLHHHLYEFRQVEIRLPGTPPQHWPVLTEQEHRNVLHCLLDEISTEEIRAGVRVSCSYICADTGHIRRECGLDCSDHLSPSRQLIRARIDEGDLGTVSS